jgi:hypothetical protein
MRARSLAGVLWVATVSLVAGSLVLGLANRSEVPLYEVPSAIIGPTFATLGTLISSRRPGNVIGWIFLATGILVSMAMFSSRRERWRDDNRGSSPSTVVCRAYGGAASVRPAR